MNLGSKRLILARDIRSRSWPNISDSHGFWDIWKNNFHWASVVRVWGSWNRKNESTPKMDSPLPSFKIHVVALKVHLLFNWRQIDATVKINLTEKLKRCSQSIFNEGQKSLEGRFLGSLLTTFTVGICPKTHRDPWWLTFSLVGLVGHSANNNNK